MRTFSLTDNHLLEKRLAVSPNREVIVRFVESYSAGGPKITILDDPRARGRPDELLLATRKGDRIFACEAQTGEFHQLPIDWDFAGDIRRGRWLRDGSLMIQARNPTETVRFSSDGSVIDATSSIRNLWHGSWSIDEGMTGSILCAEYQIPRDGEPSPISVWKYAPSTPRWRELLRKTTPPRWKEVLRKYSAPRPPAGDVRHFHTCIADSDIEGRWYVSSGDNGVHNRLFVSDDDGETWSEPTLRLDASHLPIDPGPRVFRFTSALSLGAGHLIWATDDALGGTQSAVCSARVDTEHADVRIESLLSKNYARNIVRHASGLSVVLTESKSDLTGADLLILDDGWQVKASLKLPNLNGAAAGFTGSSGSREFVDDCLYLPTGGSILTQERRGFLRMELEFADAQTPGVTP